MSRILLADDSPHAQRMGERILREEGFEVVSLTDGETVLLRLADVDPDLILADAFLPGKSGFDLCRFVKANTQYRHVRVVLTAGLLEQMDEDEATRVGADAVLKKPFEASLVMNTIRPLIDQAQASRAQSSPAELVVLNPAAPLPEGSAVAAPAPLAPASIKSDLPPDAERVRAAVILALDASLPTLIDEITERVLIALGH